MDVAEMKVHNTNAKADNKKAQAKAHKGAGAALAVLIIKDATAEVKAAEKRNQGRMKFVHSISKLAPEGHAEFRAELRRELLALTEGEQLLGQADPELKEAESTVAGYSANSFRVMVSCFSTISFACEAGMVVAAEAKWDNVLREARAIKAKLQVAQAAKAQADGKPGTKIGRKAGGGRKAKSAFETAYSTVEALSEEEQVKLMTMLATSLGYSLVKMSAIIPPQTHGEGEEAAPAGDAPAEEPALS